MVLILLLYKGNGCTNMNDIIDNNGYKKFNVNAEKIFSEGIRYSLKAVFSTYAPILNLYVYLLILIVIILIYAAYINFKATRNFQKAG